MELFAQILGFVGMTLNLISFQLKEQKKLIRLQFFSSIVFACHYLLLGAITGCILNVVGIARAFVYSNKEQPWAKHRLWLYGFIAAYFGVTVGQLLGHQETGVDVLEQVDIAFYGDFKELDESEKEAVRDMVRIMRQRRAAKQRE